jgi:hypothetical protein
MQLPQPPMANKLHCAADYGLMVVNTPLPWPNRFTLYAARK